MAFNANIKKNARSKAPSFQFYPNDWLGDLALQASSIGARGLFIQLLSVMHNSSEPGKLLLPNGLVPSHTKTAQLCNVDTRQFKRYIPELLQADVLKESKDGMLYCKRMIKDSELRNMRRMAGMKGGNPNLVKQKVKQAQKENPTPSHSSTTSLSYITTTAANNVVAVVDIPTEIKQRFSNQKAFVEFYKNCGQDVSIAKSYLDYVDKAKNIDNPIGLAIKLAKENKEQGPPLTPSQIDKAKKLKDANSKKLLSKIIWPEFIKQRKQVIKELTPDEIKQAKEIVFEIAKQVIEKEKPETEIEAERIKSEIKSGQFDLFTGEKRA